jgi:radical SAM enzyme (TIGR01210 family)
MHLMDQTQANKSRPHAFQTAPTNVNGVHGERLMIVLRSPGCLYFQSEATTCSFCGFQSAAYPDLRLADEDYCRQIQFALSQTSDRARDIIEVNVYNSGNFFSDAELSPNARGLIAGAWADCRGLRRLTVDSRPELLSGAKLRAFRDAIRPVNTDVDVGLGLEVYDDAIRRDLLNKSLTREAFVSALRMLKDEGFGALVYIMLKPTVMTDHEALDQVLLAGEFVSQQAGRLALPYRFALEPTFVVEGTRLAARFKAGEYSPPSLELVTKAAAGLRNLGPTHVGVWDEDLPILAKPGGDSSASRLSAIERFNLSQDLRELIPPLNAEASLLK